MRRSVVHSMVVALTVACLAGCQSGPQWAWWKRDKAPVETSVAARTAAPALPSSQAAPKAVAGTGIEAATPPSTANLAGATAPAPTVATPAGKYPTTSAAPTYPLVSTSAAGSATIPGGAVAAGAAPTATPSGAVAKAGPYDPNSYRPTASPVSPSTPAAGGTAPSRYADSFSGAADNRYGPLPASPAVTPITAAEATTPGSAMSNPGPVSAASDNRYSTSSTVDSAPRYSSLPTEGTPQRYGATTDLGAAIVATPGSTPAGETVQITSPAGQYRPGGTSNYTSGPAADHVEIATRPSNPASAMSAAGTTDPFPAPPASISPTTGSPQRPY